ncbi:MAG: phosphoribosylaminoimidazolesuccinocarboxamide synthase [Bacteroidetes bacterium]|nr:phosphoribosylaminoimidazolesuccinocarboxamide synthase [Bacteroidota bacterium]
MPNALKETNFHFPGQISKYKGKVRDVYDVNGKMVMVATDRISAFDYILPRAIPFKGQVLNQLAAKFLALTNDIVPNWVEAVPDPNVTIGLKCETFPVEMVIRGYVSGHAWREYQEGKRILCGESMPDGLKEHDRFSNPIITPATKAEEGHDIDISKEEIIKQGIISEDDYEQLESYTKKLFAFGTTEAAKGGLILVDTKYEFGKVGDKIYLIDEVHTPDSSRYFYADTYEQNQSRGVQQKQLSKEFVRQWLIANGFQGLTGQKMPEMSDEVVKSITDRYIELYEKVTGEKFVKSDEGDPLKRIENNVLDYFTKA